MLSTRSVTYCCETGTPFLVLLTEGLCFGTMPGNISLAAAQKNPRAKPDGCGLVIGIIKQGTQLPGGAVIGIAASGLQCPHVSVDCFVCEVNGTVVILIPVSGVAKSCLRQRTQGYFFFHQTSTDSGVGAVCRGFEMDFFPAHKLLDASCMYFVRRVLLTEEYVDMLKAGILDPAKVTRHALENAASIAGLLLTTEALICDIPEEEKAPAMPPGGMGGGMGGMGGGMGGMLFSPTSCRLTIKHPAPLGGAGGTIFWGRSCVVAFGFLGTYMNI